MYITRQELHPDLRAELDSVRDYIDGSINEAVGAHLNNKNNPHEVTKEQVGLGNVINALQATKSEFDAHVANPNPHNTTASDIGAVPTSRKVNPGTGLSGGGALSSDITLSLNLTYLDGRYLGKNAKASDADKLDGYDSSAFFRLGQNFVSMGNNDGVRFDDSNNEFYFRMDGSDKRAYHSGNIRWGTGNPSGGKNGDIYIQY